LMWFPNQTDVIALSGAGYSGGTSYSRIR